MHQSDASNDKREQVSVMANLVVCSVHTVWKFQIFSLIILSARAKARLGSSRQVRIVPRLVSSRLANYILRLGSFRLEPAKILARSTSTL